MTGFRMSDATVQVSEYRDELACFVGLVRVTVRLKSDEFDASRPVSVPVIAPLPKRAPPRRLRLAFVREARRRLSAYFAGSAPLALGDADPDNIFCDI